MALATRNNRDACPDFEREVGRQKAFYVDAQTLSKIRIRTECQCQGNGHDRGGNLMKVHITRGPNRGSDGWVCGTAVGLTVALPRKTRSAVELDANRLARARLRGGKGAELRAGLTRAGLTRWKPSPYNRIVHIKEAVCSDR
jgi:hypothetical protein